MHINVRTRIAALALAASSFGGMALATAPQATAALPVANYKESYPCSPWDDDQVWQRRHCTGQWVVGVHQRNFETSADAYYRWSDSWHRTTLWSVHSIYDRPMTVKIYCRYSDNSLSGLKKAVSIGGGLDAWYSFQVGNTLYEPCNGVGRGIYIVVTDSATGIASYIDINTDYSGAVWHYGNEYYNP